MLDYRQSPWSTLTPAQVPKSSITSTTHTQILCIAAHCPTYINKWLTDCLIDLLISRNDNSVSNFDGDDEDDDDNSSKT